MCIYIYIYIQQYIYIHIATYMYMYFFIVAHVNFLAAHICDSVMADIDSDCDSVMTDPDSDEYDSEVELEIAMPTFSYV